jgi:Tfp pilus assembly protein PilN
VSQLVWLLGGFSGAARVMITVNFLRAEQSAKILRVKQHRQLCMTALFSSVVCLLIAIMLKKHTAELESSLDALRADHRVADLVKQQQEHLLAQMSQRNQIVRLVEDLHIERSGTAGVSIILREIINALPAALWLSDIEQGREGVRLLGYADRAEGLSTFAHTLEEGQLFSAVRVDATSRIQSGDGRGRSFVVHLAQQRPSEPDPQIER